jgi:hypothetical protein
LPVLSVAVYLEVGLQGLDWDQTSEEYWEETLGNTRWPYLGLPALEARTYVEGDNLLGVALSVLMRVGAEETAWLKARAMQRIAAAELTAYRRHLLMECIEAYLPLEGPHLEEFRRLLLTEDFKEARMLGKTSFELGQRELLRDQLEARFGTLSETALSRLDAVPFERLRALGRDLLRARSLVELGLEGTPGDTKTSS